MKNVPKNVLSHFHYNNQNDFRNKVRPGQKFRWVREGKNPIRHVKAYTLNMDETIIYFIEYKIHRKVF
jgi:hypothetical protein